jgi:SAM-dependent methyltransferase
VPTEDKILEVFSSAGVVGEYARNFGRETGFLNAGERAAFLRVAAESRGAAILDVGVGPGRTTALLLLLSDDYVAVDYSESMIAEFARNYPDVRRECLDARDLSHFRAGQFGLIVFSNNAIDAVSHEDRQVILSEFARLLAPGGLIVFSTMSKLGPWYGERPFQFRRPTMPFRMSPRIVLIAIGRRLLNPMAAWRSLRNWWIGRRLMEDHEEWAVGPFAPHDFGLVIHFTTLPDLAVLLSAAGLRTQAIYDDQGRPIALDDDGRGVGNFTVVASRDQHQE